MKIRNSVLELCDKVGGWMYDEELLWLNVMVQNCQQAVEIGVWQGKSTTAIALGLPEHGKLYAIDSWRGSDDELDAAHSIMQTTEGQRTIFLNAMSNLFEFISFGKVIPICMSSTDASVLFEPILTNTDFVFIDGSHDYASVKQDIQRWLPLTNREGVIAGHDYTWPGVEKAVKEAFGDKVRRGPGSIWYVRCSEVAQ